MNGSHPSVQAMSRDYFNSINQTPKELPSWYFCDNPKDADECAAWVLSGDKRATASSLWWLEHSGEPMPEVGDLNIVTNWSGVAQCIIKTTQVVVRPYLEIDAAFAHLEGEGDKSLAYWRQVHWAYYHRELAIYGQRPTLDMPIVCESFEVVYR